MAEYIPPRRARLKRKQSEVLGVSYAEQKMIEKALMESLKECPSKQIYYDESDTDNSSCCGNTSSVDITTVDNTSSQSNKPLVNSKNMSNKSPKLCQPVKVTKTKQSLKDKQSPEDPAYKPLGFVKKNASQNRRKSERSSKTITNIKLNLSIESNKEELTECYPTTAVAKKSATVLFPNENDVVVISDSTSSTSNNSSADGSSESDEMNTSKENDLLSIRKPKQMQLIGVKTQKIMFKAVKKSSSHAPGLSSPAINLIKKNASVTKKSTQKKPSKKAALPKSSSPYPSSMDLLYRSSSPIDSVEGFNLFSDWSSCEDNDRSFDIHQTSTPTKDSDKSSYQAQRKFAAYSGPCNQSDHDVYSLMVDPESSCNVPSTEDFLHFLCLRTSDQLLPESLKVFNTPWTPLFHPTKQPSKLRADKPNFRPPVCPVKKITGNNIFPVR